MNQWIMRFAKYICAFGLAFSLFVFSGCFSFRGTGSLGYSVLLWSNSEHEIPDGTILKVYIKSNISQVYVVSLLKSKEKFELPLWQVTEPSSRGRAEKQKEKYSEFARTYASVKLDGLPIREEAVNTSKQVYRLREGEIVRCLYRGEGAAVTNGKGNMSGEWLRVLTSTGTEGWCFSHNLELFEAAGTEVSFNQKNETENQDEDLISLNEEIENLALKKWYPESFSAMIKNKRINPVKMNSSYGFDFGIKTTETEKSEENGKIVDIEIPIPASEVVLAGTATFKDDENSLAWNFTDIKKRPSGDYEFVPSSLVLNVRGKTSAVAQYMENGKTKIINLVSLDENISELAQKENERRQSELVAIFSAGPEFKSSSYGTIKFSDANSMKWNGYKMLVPSVISSSAKGDVKLSIEYFISNELKSSYDGVLTMRFENMKEPVNFLYKLTDSGLRLEDASKAACRGDLIAARSSSPLIMFFEKNN